MNKAEPSAAAAPRAPVTQAEGEQGSSSGKMILGISLVAALGGAAFYAQREGLLPEGIMGASASGGSDGSNEMTLEEYEATQREARESLNRQLEERKASSLEEREAALAESGQDGAGEGRELTLLEQLEAAKRRRIR